MSTAPPSSQWVLVHRGHVRQALSSVITGGQLRSDWGPAHRI